MKFIISHLRCLLALIWISYWRFFFQLPAFLIFAKKNSRIIYKLSFTFISNNSKFTHYSTKLPIFIRVTYQPFFKYVTKYVGFTGSNLNCLPSFGCIFFNSLTFLLLLFLVETNFSIERPTFICLAYTFVKFYRLVIEIIKLN